MATILDLPAEIVISVASHLNTKDLGPLRRSCKRLEKHLFETFANEFFTKRQFMVEHASLKALVEISKHPVLSQRLVEVLISTQKFQEFTTNPTYSLENPSREWLIGTGQARDMLAEAFSRLKNLRSVGLRDYSSKGRVREGLHGRWNSYGWSTNLAHLDVDQKPSILFSMVLSALGSTPAFPEELKVILRHSDKLITHAFRVTAANSLVVSRLKTLFLTLGADPYKPSTAQGMQLPCEEAVRRFLYIATDLKALRLNFDWRVPVASRLLDWLGTAPTPIHPSLDSPGMLEIPPASLHNLTQLDIGMAYTSDTSLLRVLSRFRLKSFSLWRVTLLSSDQNKSPVLDQWERFLSTLSNFVDGSNSIHKVLIGRIKQYSSDSRTFEQTMFCPEGTEDKTKLDESDLQDQVEFRDRYGTTVSSWLETLSGRTYVHDIHAPPPSPESDSEEEDDSSDYGDGEDDDEDDDNMDTAG